MENSNMPCIFLYRLGLKCYSSKLLNFFFKLKPILEHPVFGDNPDLWSFFTNFSEFTLSFVKINVAYFYILIAKKKIAMY